MNPELRQTLNTISRNFETANEAAQENIYTFTQLYIDPCLAGLKLYVNDCTAACFPTREERLRRRRGRSRGQSDYHFDFYDDWADDEDVTYGNQGWRNDELDSLLAGRGSRDGQPNRQRAMSYGARGRRKAHGQIEEDPNIIPSSSHFGFLERLPFRIGARGLRYKPSAADLQENPGGLRIGDVESEPLIDSDEERVFRVTGNKSKHRRQRSDTEASRSTTHSLSSRGDLIYGDEEEDAVPIDDEFAVMLSRRTTEDSSKPRDPMRTVSNRSLKSSKSRKSQDSGGRKSLEPIEASPVLGITDAQPTSMADLTREEQGIIEEEEMEIAQKRKAAAEFAKTKGFELNKKSPVSSVEIKSTDTESNIPTATVEEATPLSSPNSNDNAHKLSQASPISSNAGYHGDSETEPFPSIPTSPLRDLDEHPDPP